MKKQIALIVDDSLKMFERLREILLENASIEEVFYAENLCDAMILLEKVKPNLVFLDICLPDGSGLDLLPVIRQKGLGIVVVIISNNSHEYYRLACSKLGADYFIDKYNDFESIPGIIGQATLN